MAKKVKGRLADDIRASLQEVLKYARGEKTEVIMRRVVLSDSAAPRRARCPAQTRSAAAHWLRSRPNRRQE
jgi:hypothetical protein